jgi:hypothetical protein
MYGRKKFSINSWDRNRSRKHFSKHFSVAVNPTTMYPIGKKKNVRIWIQDGTMFGSGSGRRHPGSENLAQLRPKRAATPFEFVLQRIPKLKDSYTA